MTTPVYILSGFLGSGKTTLLQQMLQSWRDEGKTPAVIMNEIGDVNLDGMMLDQDVAMAELLSGCICCSNRVDLGLELYNLMQNEQPDMIVIEASGVANPIEILDAVTEIALYNPLELRNLITVVDTAHLWQLYKEQQGKTYRLMQEQIRSASLLVLNKSDLVSPEQLEQVQSIVRGWNAYAPVHIAVRCNVDRSQYEQEGASLSSEQNSSTTAEHDVQSCAICSTSDSAEPVHDETIAEHAGHRHMHHSHEHVMVYTHYFQQPVNSEEFEKIIAKLPAEVYRAKGILTFSDTSSRFLFQYAYRQMDFMKTIPQKPVPDVAVFIGEYFDKRQIQEQLLTLERQATES
ncbi:CobW family GTP-binding protein [Paenibacillus bovis]|uniref:Cobalamin biosynthesis protein n=1 Tax=Paenibacillus bovis TaxID=1616788 RepID=A0A172ZG35_9BACL|nr:GTP-binding protein [Paenibacillus bovis]ANF96596.1 cobalamin biosynthesis protein [Paenibacillus bovis]